MQYKCMEREIRKLSMEGFYFLICLVYREYSAGMQLWQRGINESLYTDFPLSPLLLPGRLEAERILQNTLKP